VSRALLVLALLGPLAAWGASQDDGMSSSYDLIIRNGTVFDGSGHAPIRADVAVRGERIAAIGQLSEAKARSEINANGLAVAPGFINMLSWATETLLVDGTSQSDIRQGVTLEVFGEGESMGPLNPEMKQAMLAHQGDVRFPIAWTTLSEYLEYLVKKGVSPNVASFVGATTVREHEIGYADRPPTAAELERMKALVAQAMEEGALGVGSALIYAPAFYAKPDELIALAKVASRYGGLYISHLRSEGTRLLEAIDELIDLGKAAQIPVEIYHFKAAGQPNWSKLDAAIQKIEEARRDGLHITADMYTYTAAATGLDASMPPWVQEGGYRAWVERLKNRQIRDRLKKEMPEPAQDWENLFAAAGGPQNILLVGFKNPKLKGLTGKTLAQAAALRGRSAEDTAMDLVIEDGSRVEAVYWLMSEENVRKEIRLPWVSFGSDTPSLAPAAPFSLSSVHPRAYGNVARLLGKYVREEKIISLAEAVRRLTSLPAENLKLKERGAVKPDYFADLVVFDPNTIQDHATYDRPHQYSTGVVDVFVNGVPVLKNGRHTGATPGQVVRGPGWKGK
jgi:N-acyl-D-amino-acid deacylase